MIYKKGVKNVLPHILYMPTETLSVIDELFENYETPSGSYVTQFANPLVSSSRITFYYYYYYYTINYLQ